MAITDIPETSRWRIRSAHPLMPGADDVMIMAAIMSGTITPEDLRRHRQEMREIKKHRRMVEENVPYFETVLDKFSTRALLKMRIEWRTSNVPDLTFDLEGVPAEVQADAGLVALYRVLARREHVRSKPAETNDRRKRAKARHGMAKSKNR